MTPVDSGKVLLGESRAGGCCCREYWVRSAVTPYVEAFIALNNVRKSKLDGDIGLNNPITWLHVCGFASIGPNSVYNGLGHVDLSSVFVKFKQGC